MSRRSQPRPWWQHAAGLVVLAAMAVQAFGRGVRIPVLGWLDLAIHEAGHVLTIFLPDVANAMMGNGFQTLVPLSLGGVFLMRERDWLGAVLCLGWAATTLQDASVYIADAPHQRLQLIGGYHDWAFVLAELDVLGSADVIARLVWTSGLLLMIVALAAAAAAPWIETAFLRHGARAVLAAPPPGELAQDDPAHSDAPSTRRTVGFDDYFIGPG